MKRQIYFNRRHKFLVLLFVLGAIIFQQQINYPTVKAKTKFTSVSFSENSAQQQSPCSCADKKDILYRIKEVEGAIAEYKKQIKFYESTNTIYTYSEYHDILQVGKIQPVVNLIYQAEPLPKANTATAATHPISCTISVNGGSPCLQKAIRLHEESHQNICQLRNNGVADYRDGMTMAQVAQEEINGYLIEINYLKSEYAKFPDSCKVKWFLAYEVQLRYHSPPTKSNNKAVDKSWKTWDIEHSYSASNIELSPTNSTPTTPLVLPDMTNMSQAERINAAMEAVKNQANQPTPKISTRKYWSHQSANKYPKGYVPFEINIDDKMVKYLFEECKGDPLDYIMTTETTKTWKGSGEDGTNNKFRFEADSANKVYNITIPIVPLITYLTPVSVDEKTIRDQTILKPPHRENIEPNRKLSFQAMGMANVKGLLENAEIHHSTDQKLDINLDTLIFDSGWVKATEIFNSDLSSLIGKLEVKVYYKLSKIPGK